MRKLLAPLMCLAILSSPQIHADPLTPGNLLVTEDGVIYELTTDGQIIQTIPIEYPGGPSSTSDLGRDLVVSESGLIHVFNGTFDPFVSSIDPSAANPTWSHQTEGDFSIVNNVTYGGIASFGNRIFATDQFTFGDSSRDNIGILVFDEVGSEPFRFALGTDAIDVTIGLDGLVYVLAGTGSPSGRALEVYNPETYELVRSAELRTLVGDRASRRAVAADEAGTLYLADIGGQIQKVEWGIDGSVTVESFSFMCPLSSDFEIPCFFSDIDFMPDGNLVLGDRLGNVNIVDPELMAVQSIFSIGDRTTFVAVVPEPSGLALEAEIFTGRSTGAINPSRTRNINLAIYSTEEFDARTIDSATARLGPAEAPIGTRRRVFDVNGDGSRDAYFRFRTSETGVACGDTEITFSAFLDDGTAVSTTLPIETVGCN
ncbi:MAG: hypothetical protein AAF578_02675 [Pseudomonadota bacterium]